MTERLYDINAYCHEFNAVVKSCTKSGDGYAVVLDKTAFFPEGGGQAPDEGTINGVAVLDVQIAGGEIIHKTEKEFSVGEEVECKLDWALRFSRMQSHSGEHIVSGLVHSLFGYNNVGFHMSRSEMTVDFDGVLSQEDIDRVEELSNLAIYENKSITISYPTKEEAEGIEYRSKLENIEDLRLVSIEGTDCCACCAPHVMRTGEIGIIKIIDATPNKGGTRITMLAGIEALRDYAFLNRSNKRMMKSLSSPRDAVADNLDKQLELIGLLRNENQQLLKRVAWSELRAVEINGSAYAFCKNLSYEELRHCSNLLTDEGKKLCILFSTDDNENYIYVVSGADGVKPIVDSLNAEFNGKGGGRPNYAQGKIVSDSEQKIKAFVEALIK